MIVKIQLFLKPVLQFSTFGLSRMLGWLPDLNHVHSWYILCQTVEVRDQCLNFNSRLRLKECRAIQEGRQLEGCLGTGMQRERNTMMTKLGKRGWVGDISEDWVEYRQTDRK